MKQLFKTPVAFIAAIKRGATAVITLMLTPIAAYAESVLCFWATSESNFVSGTYPQPTPKGSEVVSVRATIAVTTALAAGDVLEFLKLPAGCLPVDWIIDCPDLDSNGAPTLAMDVGIINAAGDAISTASADGGDEWVDGGTIGQAAGVTRPTSTATFRCSVDDDTDRTVGIVIATGAATAVAGTIGFTLSYRAAYQGA